MCGSDAKVFTQIGFAHALIHRRRFGSLVPGQECFGTAEAGVGNGGPKLGRGFRQRFPEHVRSIY